VYPPDVFRNTLVRLLDVLERLRVRCHVTGGVTSVAYGEPRMTQDIDLVVDNAALGRVLPAFVAAVGEAGFFLDAAAVRTGVDDHSMFQLFDEAEALKVDVYPRELIPGELDRSVMIEVFEGMKIPCVARVDAAASKLVWASLGSHKSRRDLRRMIVGMSEPERLEFGRLADTLGHATLLGEILAEPDEISG
jgi:hypothetical protein